jgi:hypothetical protein
MPTGGDSPPMGWTPMPDPADGGVGSPPFPVNLTAQERTHLEAFDALDFRSVLPPGHACSYPEDAGLLHPVTYGSTRGYRRRSVERLHTGATARGN